MIPEVSPQFTSLSRARVPFEIVAQITQNIAQGAIPPGSRLPSEPELMAQLGVGRNALREAIKILETFGLAVIRRGDGTYIQDACTFDLLISLFLSLIWVKPSEQDLREFFLSTRHAQLVFEDRPPHREELDAYQTAYQAMHLLVKEASLGFLPEHSSLMEGIESYLAARDGLSGEMILSQLVTLSHSLFTQSSSAESNSAVSLDWSLLTGRLESERTAIETGAPADISAYLQIQRQVWEDKSSKILLSAARKPGAFQPSARQPASKTIFWSIMSDIINGRYQVGDRLPTEAEMIEEYQVSRNVVREAIKSLEATGILEIRRPEGTFVAEPNDAASAFIDWGAYGRILSNENAARFLRFKAAVRDAVFWLACQKATPEERKRFQTLSTAFAQSLLAPAPILDQCMRTLTELNSYLSEICANPILYRIEQIVLRVAAQSRSLFVENALETGRQREVVQSYLRDADAMASGDLDAVPQLMTYKLWLWSSLEIADFHQEPPQRLYSLP